MKKLTKKNLAAFSMFIILLNLIVQQFVRINVAKAMVFGGDETDIFSSGIASPSCDANSNQHNSKVATSDERIYALVWQDDSCDGPGNGTGIYVELYDKVTGAIPAMGGPIRVNQTLNGNQKNPSIAMDHNGNFIVTWEGNGADDPNGIYMRAFNRDGTAKGNEVLVNSHTTGIKDSPQIAMNFGGDPSGGQEDHFVVVWHGEGDGDKDGVYMQRYNLTANGNIQKVGSNTQVNTYTIGDQKDPAVAMNNMDEVIVTWSGPGQNYPSSNEVWMQGYDSNNIPWGKNANNIRVNSISPATKPAIASNKSNEPENHNVPGGHFVIVYKGGNDNEIYGKLIDRCSTNSPFCSPGNVELNINKTPSDLPSVAMDYLGNFTVGWEQNDSSTGQDMNIHAMNYDYMGHRIDNGFMVNENVYGDASANQTESAIAKDKDGGYLITWTSPGTTKGLDVRYRNFGTDIFKHGTETLANTSSNFTESNVVSAIAPNGNHIVAFIGQDPNSGQTRIYYSLYDNNGNVIVQNQAADTVNDSSVASPSIAFFKDTSGSGVGRFIIVWTGNNPGGTSGQQVMYREFNSSGTPATANELLVNNIVANATYDAPRISAGYYNNDSNAVIDDFAVIYQISNDTPTTGVIGTYHTQNSFTSSALEPMSSTCTITCTGTGIDMYPDINANDRIIYTWDAGDGDQSGIFAREANSGSFSGETFRVNNTTSFFQGHPDVAFVSPTQYVISWTSCESKDCNASAIYASRYTGDFNNSSPTKIDDNFIVYPGGGADQLTNDLSRISADPTNGSFVIVWAKTLQAPSPLKEIEGKFYQSASGLTNFGVGFTINSTTGINPQLPDVDMNTDGEAIVSWQGTSSGTNADSQGAIFQLLNNPSFIQTLPELPASAQLSITQGGKTLTIPSTIQFPSITATTTASAEVEQQIDQNPAPGQPLYFQLEDLGGNSTNCAPGPCYSVSMNASDFTYKDAKSGQIYSIPSSDVFIKNYDGSHPDVGATGDCGTLEAGQSFETLFGNSTDFSLDSSTCNYASLDSNRTLLNKIMSNSDTAKIRWYPKLKIIVPALTPPGTYTGTITITSA